MGFRIIEGITEEHRGPWREFVELHPDGTIFQTPEFADLFEENEQSGRDFIAVVDDAGKMLALVLAITMNDSRALRSRFASRTIIYGGPLIDPGLADPGEKLGMLLEALVEKVKKTSLFIEVRNLADRSHFTETFARSGFRFKERLNLIIDTRNREEVESCISRSKTRQVKKSLEAGAVVKQASSPGEIEEFYVLLKDLYRNKVRKPVPSLGFFQKFYKATLQRKLGIILLVVYQEKVVAGMVCPIMQGQGIYEWYVCGADQQYPEIHPSVLVTWAAIDFALKNDLPRFDFMGMGQPGRKYGVRHFKTRFGGTWVNYGRFIRINKRIHYLIAKTGFFVLGRLKKV
jgi:serine/alanine adding enzyme